MSDSAPIGLIAGEGRLPILCARGIKAAGRRSACVGLIGQYSADLPGLCDFFDTSGIIRIGRWIRLLKKWGVREAVLIGRVRKTKMYDPFVAFRQMPDWRAANLWYRVLRHDRRSDTLLRAVADELAKCGITLIDSTRYIPEHVADLGVMTKVKPSPGQLKDIEFALPIIARMGELDIGQAVSVKDREIIAVEAIEGTDALIERTGPLCKSGKWVLVKVAKPIQDMRLDVPVIGMTTLEKLRAAGGSCLAIEADRTIMVDKPQLIEAANEWGIAVVGVAVASAAVPVQSDVSRPTGLA